jgi:hypothetical protein
MVAEFSQIISKLNYDHIYIVCTFTGALRWFNTRYDQHINYMSWFKNNIKNIQDFDLLPIWRNQVCVNTILEALKPFDHITLKIGTNFVDPIGFEALNSTQRLSTPWYQLLNCADIGPVYTDMYYETVSQAVEFIDKEYHTIFKQWLLGIIEQAQRRIDLLTDPDIFWNYHPLSLGHKIWADYLLKNLILC